MILIGMNPYLEIRKKKTKIYNSSRNPEFPPFISSSVSMRFDPSGNFL